MRLFEAGPQTTTTSKTSTFTTTTRKSAVCSLIGKCKGVVDNCEDPYHCEPVELKAFITSDVKNRTLSYTVQDHLRFFAANFNIRIDCCCHEFREAFVHGRGLIEMKSDCGPVTMPVKFDLTVWDNSFKMKITSYDKEFIHNSGIITCIDKKCRLELCC
jgi:hypothetical protein